VDGSLGPYRRPAEEYFRVEIALQARLTATLVNLERLFVLDGFARPQPAPHAA
jgi:hypothetical protein